MEETGQEQEKRGTLKAWIIVVSLAVLFMLWGIFIYFSVGDKGPPPWDFGVIRDVPGESPYSTERPSK